MPLYKATIHHNEKTFEDLAHMQYDLFCKSNRYSRTMLSVVLIVVGVLNAETWWAFPLIGYAWYLISSTYASSNHTARKLSRKIQESGMDFPSSRYEFTENGMRIISLPDGKVQGNLIEYDAFLKLGEDNGYFYLFPNTRGGYMIPKYEIPDENEFREFIQGMTGKIFQSKTPPAAKLLKKLNKRKNEPYRLKKHK